jgi:hypothetical protein
MASATFRLLGVSGPLNVRRLDQVDLSGPRAVWLRPPAGRDQRRRSGGRKPGHRSHPKSHMQTGACASPTPSKLHFVTREHDRKDGMPRTGVSRIGTRQEAKECGACPCQRWYGMRIAQASQVQRTDAQMPKNLHDPLAIGDTPSIVTGKRALRLRRRPERAGYLDVRFFTQGERAGQFARLRDVTPLERRALAGASRSR